MWIIRNLIVFVWWVLMSWFLLRNTTLWFVVCAALMCAAPLARYITFRVDIDEIPAPVGSVRFTTLQALTALTIAKAANYSGKIVAQDPKKIMRLEE